MIWRRIRTWGLVLAGLVVAVSLSLIAVFRSSWFHEQVRLRIVQEIENASGGRVEINSFSFNWKTLTAEVRGFALHGTEPSGEQPLFRADSIRLGLHIVSMMERRIDLTSLEIEHPQARILVRPDGTSNIPGPKHRTGNRDILAQVLDLKIGKFSLREGSAVYNSAVWPLDASGEGLTAALVYDRAKPEYRGNFRTAKIRVIRPLEQPVELGLETEIALRRSEVILSEAHLALAKSSLDISGEIRDLAVPRGEFRGKARLLLGELARPFRLPVANGEVLWSGSGSFSTSPADFILSGRINGSGLNYRDKSFDVRNAVVVGDARVTPSSLRIDGLSVMALGGKLRGTLELKNWRDLQINAKLVGLPLEAVAADLHKTDLPWRGNLQGPVQLTGRISKSGFSDAVAHAEIDISPESGGVPLTGTLDVNYDQRAGSLQFGESHLKTGSTQVDFSGAVGTTLQVKATSANLEDILPALYFAGVPSSESLPIRLKSGSAHLEITISGPLASPDIRGLIEFAGFTYEGHSFDRLRSGFEVNSSFLTFQDLELDRNNLRVKGNGRVGLQEWKPASSSPVSAAVTVQNADIHELLEESGSKAPVAGMAAANLQISGTYGVPQIEGKIQALHVTGWDEKIDGLSGNMQLAGDTIRLVNVSVEAGNARASGSVVYHKTGIDWRSGEVQFDALSDIPDITRFEGVRKMIPDVGAVANLKASGSGRVTNGEFRLNHLDGNASFEKVTLHGNSVGTVALTAKSSGNQLQVETQGKLLDSSIQGKGDWRLDGDHNGQGSVDFSPIALRELAAFLNSQGPSEEAAERERRLQRFNFAGSAAGSLAVRGPFDSFDRLSAQLRLAEVHLSGIPELQIRAGAKPQDLVVASTEPVVVDINSKEATIVAAHFAARNTTLSLGGKFSFENAAASNLKVEGSINLAVLQLLNRDLLAAGQARITASLRGTVAKPELSGRMDLENASLFLPDLPNGVDNANGVITFDRNRATIQSLTAETGGGKVSFKGFVGFGAVLVYRLEATADQVRYRTPEGVSFTMNALLSLVGTSENSVVSGSISIVRANLTPLTDIGNLLAKSANPAPTLEQRNEYLRGMHFDIFIESAQSLEVRTTLARDLQANIDLHLRGTPQQPVLLGSLNVNQGEIDFLGTQYTIDRGEALFSNPLKMEPTIDLSLETRVRGITVTISLSGPLQKINLSYRSDPPLDSSQIIALLAVGRDPNAQAFISTTSTQGNPLAGSAGSLLASALTAPVSNRLNRLFGGTTVKIDPQASTLTEAPQARLVLEQPISKDITLTYVTGLRRTDEQIVRVEWDFNNNWSAIASREADGLFGLVFQYRKRFK